MGQPVWNTTAGTIGTYPSGSTLQYIFSATPDVIGDQLIFTLLNGNLPSGLLLEPSGLLTGTVGYIAEQTDFNFTLRVTDSYKNISDRTFSITVAGQGLPTFATPNGRILNVLDSVYVDYKFNIVNNSNIPYITKVSGGVFPPGLSMDIAGRITGYPEPPFLENGSPTTKVFSFTVQLISEYGVTNGSFNIQIRNQLLTKSEHEIAPVILNKYPLNLPLDDSDPYYSYYLLETSNLGTVRANEYFNFKFIGYDFEEDGLTYSFSALPPGLVGNNKTGWVTGKPIIATDSIADYNFTVVVYKTDYPNVKSSIQQFTLRITNIEEDVTDFITWKTDSNLGTLFNGDTSNLYVNATGIGNITYELDSGRLPYNLTLLPNGSIIGKVSFEPESEFIPTNTKIETTFSVRAFLTDYPVVSSIKEFTITVDKKFGTPVENVYFKATPNLEGRLIIQSLLTDTSLIPDDYLYRPEDINFGKASNVKVVMTYGIEANKLEAYLQASTTNFYNRKLVLGELKTAIATNSSGEILYEVVYSEVIDDLITPEGKSIPSEIYWPQDIVIGTDSYYTTSTSYYTSSTILYTSEGTTIVRRLYPASTVNMRDKLISALPYNNSQDLLPLWMTSQQADGNTIGFKLVWVICYTLPGKSGVIKNNINSYWAHKLNQVDFSIDRFLVDKSSTYNYNLYTGLGSWGTLPGATPTPDPVDTYDLPVLFPRTNILPDTNQQ